MATLNRALRISGTTKSELDHLIDRVAKRIAQAANFLDVRATPQDWPAGQPDTLNGYRPHIAALEWKSMKWREALWYVINEDSLPSDRAKAACRELSQRAEKKGGSFYLVAPLSLAAKVKEWADQAKIRVHSFWIFSDHQTG